MLHIIKDTKLGYQYSKNPFEIMSMETYVDLVVQQLERLPETMVIARLTGDGIGSDLLAPNGRDEKLSY
ncbi:hypothetical protein MGH68_05120 [Erysipelothrix sp. D19-032]